MLCLTPSGDDAAVIRLYADSNVEVDDAFDAHKDAFHRQKYTGFTGPAGSGRG